MRLAEANTPENQFVTGPLYALAQSYEIVLGANQSLYFGEVGIWLIWILYFLTTVINTIVMLNLLIAIMMNAFDTVNSNAV